MQTFINAKCPDELKQRYFGMVIDNFQSVNSSETVFDYQWAFYHIVDKPQTATEILDRFNKESMNGEIRFLALSICDKIEYDDATAAEGALKAITYDSKYHKVFLYIHQNSDRQRLFHERVLETLHISTDFFYEYFSEEGALTAIQKWPVERAIELYHKRNDVIEISEALKHDLRDTVHRLETATKKLEETQQLFEQQQQIMVEIQKLKHILDSTDRQIDSSEKKIQTKTQMLEKHEAMIQELNKSKDDLEEELKLPLLSISEEESANMYLTAIQEKKHQQQLVIDRIKELETKRSYLEEHEQTLRRRYSQLEEESTVYSNHVDELEYQESEIERFDDKLSLSSSQMSAIQKEKSKMNQQINELKQEIQNLNEKKRVATEQQSESYRRMDTMKIQKKALSTELDKLIKETACCDQTITNTDIIDMTENDVNCELSIARHQLKTFGETSHFDLDLLSKFANDKKQFHRRREELIRIEKKIVAAMEKVDADIDASIASTFNDLSEWFSKIFTKIVSNGQATMELVESESVPGEIRYTGLDVVFANQSGLMKRTFNDLPGPDKAVVALVIILSLQRLNPSQFYLFDHIDEVTNQFDICKVKIHCFFFSR